MQGSRRTVLILRLLGVVLAVSALSSALFVAQGGFGAGHGRFDQAIGVLGLPWLAILDAIPWLESLWIGDYVMIVLLPLAFNLCCVLGLYFLLGRRP